MSTWACLYTHQKTKKAKTWQDGILKVSINNKATLCDEEGKVLDSKFLGRGFVVECDAEMEMDRFLVMVAEMKSVDDTGEAAGSNAPATGSRLTATGGGMSIRFDGRRVVVKPGNAPSVPTDAHDEKTTVKTSSVQISSRRSLAPSLRKRKQIAPVVAPPEARHSGDEADASDDDGDSKNKRQRAGLDRSDRKRGRARGRDQDEDEADQHKAGEQRRGQPPVRFAQSTTTINNEDDTMVEEPTAPTTTGGFGSLFTAKPVFSSFAHGEEEATSMVPSSSSLASSSQRSGKRDLSAIIAALAGGSTNQDEAVIDKRMDNDDAYDRGLADAESSTVRAQGPPAPQSAFGYNELSFDDPDTDFYALAMSMEESPQKLRQASAYNPTQGAPSLRATTTTPGAGPPARPLRPSAARTPGRRSEEEEDEEEPTVAQDVAPQPVARRRVGLRRSALQRRNAEETDGPAPHSRSSIAATTSLVRTTASASAASTTTKPTKGFRSPLLKSYNSPLTAWTTKQFCFPDAEVCNTLNTSASGPPSPQVSIPDYFTSLDEYRTIFTEAITEELNFRLLDLASNFHKACDGLPSSSGSGNTTKHSCPHGPATFLVVRKDGPNKGRGFYGCPGRGDNKCKYFKWADEKPKESGAASATKPSTQVASATATSADKGPRKIELDKQAEDFLKAQKIALYANCELFKTGDPPKPTDKYIPGGSFEDNIFFLVKKKAMYVKLTWKEHYSCYNKDDVWIISSNPEFRPRNADDLFFIARSAFHGPGQSNLLEIAPLSAMPRMGRRTIVHALHGPEANSELAMLDNLRSLPPDLPLLPHVLHNDGQALPPGSKPRDTLRRLHSEPNMWKLNLCMAEINYIAEEMIATYQLNEDQQSVLQACLTWFEPIDHEVTMDKSLPIALVHGVFGAGKSFLLVVLIVFISRVLDAADNRDIHILVASSTNTAVDRVLEGLLELDFKDFMRVGSLRKISKRVIHHAPQADEKSAIKDLKLMLKEEAGGVDEMKIKTMLKEAETGHMKKKVEKISSTRVIGVTCAASGFPILDGSTFPLVILDECSQMLEPHSMIPLARFNCQKLIAVGDPLQLPPVLESFANKEDGLAKTLFIRLSTIGFPPIMLRTQYRCHPAISGIANRLFYEGKLLDGVTPEQRSPLLPTLPTLYFCNSLRGTEERAGKSYHNPYELGLIVEMVKSLINWGIKPQQIGIIALYKPQAYKIETALAAVKATDISEEYVEELLNQADDIEILEEDEERRRQVRGKQWQEKQRNKLVAKEIQVSTVDAFQGSEKEVIIVTCVRTTRLGFIDSPKRLNVTLTRAKRHLIIVGNGKVLAGNQTWTTILSQIEANGVVQDAEHFLRTREFSRTGLNAGGAAGRGGAREEPEEDYEHEIMGRHEEEGDNVDEEEHDMMMEIQREMEEEEREHRLAPAPAVPGHLARGPARQHQDYSNERDGGGQPPPQQQQSTEERVSEEEWAMLAMLEQSEAAPSRSLEEEDEVHRGQTTATSSRKEVGDVTMPEEDKRGECEEDRERATDEAQEEKGNEADDGYDPAASEWSLGDLDL